jgi:3-deoxy-manno-octulosonate cytidylyltransferase (CMP-KDO synthetase)
MKILGIIPARFASSRFPAKLIQEVNGKSILQFVYEQCLKSRYLSKVIIATDHELIFEKVKEFGAEVVMTSSKHLSGTDRCAEALILYGGAKEFDYAINIQGDEPLISPNTIDDLCGIFNSRTEIASVYKRISLIEEVMNPNIVKVVIGVNSQALYFSRSPIPFVRGEEIDNWVVKHSFFKHLGLYGFRADILEKIVKIPINNLEDIEKLEQLRWLANGYKISMQETSNESIGIDTQEDFDRFKQFLGKK